MDSDDLRHGRGPASRTSGPSGGPWAAEAGEVDWGRVDEILAVVSGRWALPLMRALNRGVSRQTVLLETINARRPANSQLSRQILIATMTRLQEAGMVRRQTVRGRPRETHYYLTPVGSEILVEVSKLGNKNWWIKPSDEGDPVAAVPEVDTTVASPARVWDFLRGGRDNFLADRVAAEAALAVQPNLRAVAQQVRLFQGDAVRRFVTDYGVRQFLDIGTGVPGAGSVHEVAQKAAPECRVVYVDNDPMVLSHARALLTSTPEGACAYIDEDLRNPGAILARAAETLDLSQPTAVLLIAVLHFIPDAADPWAITSRLLGGITGDAYLAVSHAASDLSPTADALAANYNTAVPVSIWMRPREGIARFFSGMEMIEPPGLVTLEQWFPESPLNDGAGMSGHVGIGRRPARD